MVMPFYFIAVQSFTAWALGSPFCALQLIFGSRVLWGDVESDDITPLQKAVSLAPPLTITTDLSVSALSQASWRGVLP